MPRAPKDPNSITFSKKWVEETRTTILLGCALIDGWLLKKATEDLRRRIEENGTFSKEPVAR